jgi:hypothetical protein
MVRLETSLYGVNYLKLRTPISIMSQYIFARDKWKPEKVTVLFIAESPPASGAYFYFPVTTGRDSLFNTTMKALGIYPERKAMPKGLDKKGMLAEFQARGFFLIDVCYAPINKLPPKEKKRAIAKEIPALMQKVRELNPEGVIIIKKGLFEPVKTALEYAGLGGKILNKEAILFPGSGNQRTYRRILRMLLAREVAR